MSKFVNKNTGVVVSVADAKNARFTDGWDAVAEKPAARSKKSESSDSK